MGWAWWFSTPCLFFSGKNSQKENITRSSCNSWWGLVMTIILSEEIFLWCALYLLSVKFIQCWLKKKSRGKLSADNFLANSTSLAVESQRPKPYYKGRMDKNKGRANGFHGRIKRNEGKKSSLFCNYCKKPGHSIDKCYKLHGFPPNSRVKGPRRTAALVQSNNQDIDYHHVTQSSQTVVPSLTLEQSFQMIALL